MKTRKKGLKITKMEYKVVEVAVGFASLNYSDYLDPSEAIEPVAVLWVKYCQMDSFGYPSHLDQI